MSFSLFLSLEYASSPDFKRALEKTDRHAIKERERERERDRRRAGVSTTTPTPDDDVSKMPVGKKRQNIFTQSGLDLDDVFFTLGRSWCALFW